MEPIEQFEYDVSKGMESVLREAFASNVTPATTEAFLMPIASDLMLLMSLSMAHTLAAGSRQSLINRRKKMIEKINASFSRELLKAKSNKSDFKVVE